MDKHLFLFENMKEIKDYWTTLAVNNLNSATQTHLAKRVPDLEILQGKLTSDEQEVFRGFQNEIIKGVMHSILVMIDGGDTLADKVRVDLIDEESKESLKENIALHEEFVSYLLDEE